MREQLAPEPFDTAEFEFSREFNKFESHIEETAKESALLNAANDLANSFKEKFRSKERYINPPEGHLFRLAPSISSRLDRLVVEELHQIPIYHNDYATIWPEFESETPIKEFFANYFELERSGSEDNYFYYGYDVKHRYRVRLDPEVAVRIVKIKTNQPTLAD